MRTEAYPCASPVHVRGRGLPSACSALSVFHAVVYFFLEVLSMSTDEVVQPPSPGTPPHGIADEADVQKLHMNAIGIIGLVAGAASAVAPLAAMFFNVPLIVDQAGAAVPLVFLISGVG